MIHWKCIAYWTCIGLLEMTWLIRDEVAQWRWSDLLEMERLIGDEWLIIVGVAFWRFSPEMQWLIGDGVV